MHVGPFSLLTQTMEQKKKNKKKKKRKLRKKSTDRHGSSNIKWFTIYRIHKRSMSSSALSDTQRVGHSYPLKNCMLLASNTLRIQGGDGCCTADASQCRPSRVTKAAALRSLRTADLVALASETRLAMCGVAGIVLWTLQRKNRRCL